MEDDEVLISDSEIKDLLNEIEDEELNEDNEPEPEPELEPESEPKLEQEATIATTAPVKRGRGRPRKYLMGEEPYRKPLSSYEKYKANKAKLDERYKKRAETTQVLMPEFVFPEDRLSIQEIRREAFEQNYIKLTDQISKEAISKIVTLAISRRVCEARKIGGLVNRQIESLMRMLVPHILRKCMKLYPQSITKCPGFAYTTKDGSQTAWVQPDLPYFLEQGTECSAIHETYDETKAERIARLDSLIDRYIKALDKQSDFEANCLSYIKLNNISTYIALLDAKPKWFYAYYYNIKHEIEKDMLW